ncbi:metal-sensing transcriptional repressor [Brevibacterium sp. HMSC08F02]|uniref:metal-sensing transcriptional repressor n=1 Tax=Brevibacterium sp. HMSC08F02 TaxID=1581140 RepID=UPI00114D25EF
MRSWSLFSCPIELNILRRAEGQLAAVIRQVEDDANCRTSASCQPGTSPSCQPGSSFHNSLTWLATRPRTTAHPLAGICALATTANGSFCC